MAIPSNHAEEPASRISVNTVGMWLFLAALSMLFGPSLVAYVYIRLAHTTTFAAQPVHLPPLLYVSTGIVLCISVLFHVAQSSLRASRYPTFRIAIRGSLLLACAFVAVQTPAMLALLHQHQIHRDEVQPEHRLFIYGMVFTLILVHALHVVGGIVALLLLCFKLDTYTPDHSLPVKHAAMYWHFLDIVWVLMFLTFLLAG